MTQKDHLPRQARDRNTAPATASEQHAGFLLRFSFLLVFSLAQGAARVGGGDGRAAAGAGEAVLLMNAVFR